MKRIIISSIGQAIIILLIYTILLRVLAGSNIVAGIFCPGSHLPKYYPVLIAIFVLSRLYVVLLPGFILSRIGYGLLKQQQAGRQK